MNREARQGVHRIAALCDYLERHKALKHIDAQALKKLFGNRSDIEFEDFLLEEGLVEKEDLLQALAHYYKVPAIDVTGIMFEHHLVTMFPKDVLLRNSFIPYEQEGDILTVVAAHPQDPELPEIVSSFVSYEPMFMVGFALDITDAVKEFYDESLLEQEVDNEPLEELEEEYDRERILDRDEEI